MLQPGWRLSKQYGIRDAGRLPHRRGRRDRARRRPRADGDPGARPRSAQRGKEGAYPLDLGATSRARKGPGGETSEERVMSDEKLDELSPWRRPRRVVQMLKVLAATAAGGVLSLVGAREAGAARCRRVGQPCRANFECCDFFCPPDTGRCACRRARTCAARRGVASGATRSDVRPGDVPVRLSAGNDAVRHRVLLRGRGCCPGGYYGPTCCPPGEICCPGGFCSYYGGQC